MAQVDVYVDSYSGDFVVGPQNPSIAPAPRFTEGDTMSMRIYLLARTTTFPVNPYSIINNAGLTLKVALGPKTGDAGSALYTQQFTWGKAADNSYFFADFPLNTAGIATLIGSGERASAWFEIEYSQNAVPTTVLSKNVTVEAEVIETGSLAVPAGSTPLSAEEANATFLKRKISGVIYLEDVDNPGNYLALYYKSGSLQEEAVSGTLP